MLAVDTVPGPEIDKHNFPRKALDVTGSPFTQPVPPLNVGSWLLGIASAIGRSFTCVEVGCARLKRAFSSWSVIPLAPFRTDVIPEALKATAANIITPAP